MSCGGKYKVALGFLKQKFFIVWTPFGVIEPERMHCTSFLTYDCQIIKKTLSPFCSSWLRLLQGTGLGSLETDLGTSTKVPRNPLQFSGPRKT